MGAALVSTVIPCFNALPSLEAAVDSVLSQQLPADISVEVIIVDDASTDRSAALADALAARHPGRVRALRQPINRGPAAARNLGLAVARGAFVCFLDADDRYAPLTFLRCVGLLQRRPDVAAVVTDVALSGCTRPIDPAQHSAIVRSLPSNMVVRREPARLLGGFPEDPAFRGPTAGEDIAFKLALLAAFRVVTIGDACLIYQVKPGSHLERFLDRTQVVDGRLVFTRATPGAAELARAAESYRARVRQRLAAAPPELQSMLRTSSDP